jgi:hypothetical protein
VRFGPSDADEEPQTPSRGAAAKTLFAPLPHTPSRGSRLRPTEELDDDESRDIDAPQLAPPADDGEREYAFALYPRLREAWTDDGLDARIEHWKTRLASSRTLEEGEWGADGWGTLPLAS